MTIWAQSLAKADFGVDVEVFSESDAESYVPSSNKPKIAKLKYYIYIYISIVKDINIMNLFGKNSEKTQLRL